MNKYSLILTVALVCKMVTASFGQTGPEIDSKKIIEKGVELHDDEKYDEAIAEFKKVNMNDTNYVLACVELANTYIASGKDSLAVVTCNDVLDLPSAFAPSVLLYKANALDNLKKTDEAEKVYREGMKKYPLNNSFYYELGVLKLRQEKYQEAHDLFVLSIKYNPFHANSHFQMGQLAVKQGKLIPAMLAWQYFLLLDNSSARAKNTVFELEKMAKNEYEFKDVVKIDGLSEQDDFSELEALVRSKVALSDKYKSKIDLEFNLTKQIQLILEKIPVVKDDKGFYMTFYAPIFAEMNKKKYLEPFAYNILAGMDIEKITSWMKKNKSDSDEFATWLVNYIGENYSTFPTMLNGTTQKARLWYRNDKIYAVGNQNSSKQNVGYWEYYNSNGVLKSEGVYNDKSMREGPWKFYYPTGVIKTIENYTNGDVTGAVEKFYENGSPKSKMNYVNNNLDGQQLLYYPTGLLKNSYDYKAGVENGKEAAYHPNGKLHYEIQVVNGKYEGPLVQYYDNGHISEESSFKANDKVGKMTTYYNFPEKAIKEQGVYEKGVGIGEWKTFYKNGNVDEVGVYNKDGEKSGVWKEYSDNNVISSEETYSGGKSDGSSKYYDEKGRLIEEYTYKNNILQEYKAYDGNGKVVYQNKKDGRNNYDAQLYYPNGNKKREGRVTAGKLDGSWKNYNENGYITSEANYVEGQKDGKYISYYENGKVKSEEDYSAGETNGYYKEYFKSGTLQQQGAYIKDKEIGEWKKYYENGNLKSVTFYNDGTLDGWQQYYAVNGKMDFEEFIEFGYLKKRTSYDTLGKIYQTVLFDKGTGDLNLTFANGKPKTKGTYKNDMAQGDFQEFFPDGKPMSQKHYVDGNLEGDLKYFYPNGKTEWFEHFVYGDKHGKQTQYDVDGNVYREIDYIYGDQTGKSYYYYPNKQKQKEYDLKNDNVEGHSILYAETGDMIIDRTYERDYLQSYTYYDKTGVPVPSIPVKNETGAIKCFYKTGTPSIDFSLKNGTIDGKRIVYFPNGKVQEEEEYVFGQQVGVSKYYYASGKLKGEENWANDEKNGKCTYYYENGKVKSEEFYMNDKEHGTFKYYDQTGKLTQTYVYYNGELIDEK